MKELIKIIEENLPIYYKKLDYCKTAKRYYDNQNDILSVKSPINISEYQKDINPFRNADNRISHNWFSLLVNQKVGFMFSKPPTIDVNDQVTNDKIKQILGDGFSKVIKDLCIDASCYGKAYLHIWEDGGLRFTDVNSSQIIPLYSNNLDKKLEKVIRVYTITKDQKDHTIYEFWDKNAMYLFIGDGEIKPYNQIDGKNIYNHNLGFLPFIEFSNNNTQSSDLVNVKALIDVYDKIFSGFVNDIEDVQQVILVLTNYGGEDLHSFLSDLKRYKAIDLQSDEGDTKSGISTMSIDIPIEARCELLKMTRKQIFVSGAGVDPEDNNLGTASGVAIKYLYSLLELKAGLLESEFRTSINRFIRIILKYLDIDDDLKIEQIYHRAYIRNDLEKAEVLQKIKDFTSKKTLAKNNPYVEDFDEEITNLLEEQNEGNT